MSQVSATPLSALLREDQNLLVLSCQNSAWKVIYQVGDGWILDRNSPQLLILQLSHQSAQACIVMDSHKDSRFAQFRLEDMHFRSSLCLPLHSDRGAFVGAVLVEDRQRIQAFGLQDVPRWSQAARPVAEALTPKTPRNWAAPAVSPAHMVAGALALGCGLWMMRGLWFSRPLPRPPAARVLSRQQASPETIALSIVGALSRNDYQAAYALSSVADGQGESLNKFQTEATGWKGTPENIRSFQYRRAVVLGHDEKSCRVELVGIGPAQGKPSLRLDLVRSKDGWRWAPPWVHPLKRNDRP